MTWEFELVVEPDGNRIRCGADTGEIPLHTRCRYPDQTRQQFRP